MTNNIEFIETAHKLNEKTLQIGAAVDKVLELPDDFPLTAGDVKGAFKALKDIILIQQQSINQSAVHLVEIDDIINDVIPK